MSNCKKDDTDNPTTDPIVASTVCSVAGIVVDMNDMPIQGVMVNIEGSSLAPKMTNQYGAFYFSSAVTSSRISATFSKTNFFKVTKSEVAVSNGSIIFHVMMIPKNSEISSSSILNSASGGDVALTSSDTKITFAANSFVDANGNSYSGNVHVDLAYLDPSADNFHQLIPGGDMLAINVSNDNGILYSYGIIKVEIKDANGNFLQLKSDAASKATIEVGVPPSMQSTAPAIIPLWYFDVIKGKWVEEGQATLTGGRYIGQVSHFTDWNCDVWSPTQATITGTVKDQSGLPVANVGIRTGQSFTTTNNLGVYQRNVPSGMSLDVSILNYFGHTQTKSAGMLGAEQTVTVDFIVPQMNYIRGKLLNCSQTPISGNVGITWGSNNEFSSTVFAANGVFNIPVVQNISSFTLWAYTGNSYTTKFIYPNFVNNIDTIESLFLCDFVTGANQYTIDGSEYNNQTFSNFAITKTAQYDEFNEPGQVFKNTNITIQGEDGDIYLSVNDKVVGTYSGTNCYGSVNVQGVNSLQLSSTVVTITKYGGVGQLVEGTFSASGNGVTITNGKFSVVRIPDQFFNQKKGAKRSKFGK